MPSKRSRKRRKIFVIALAALIFAETGYILGTTGLGPLLFSSSRSPQLGFKNVLDVAQTQVVAGNATGTLYPNSYVYVVLGTVDNPNTVATRIALDAAEQPVYIVALSSNIPTDVIAAVPPNTRNPVILVSIPLDKQKVLGDWLLAVGSKYGVTLQGVIRVTIDNWNPIAAGNI